MKDNWPSCDDCDFYVRIKLYLSKLSSVQIYINSDDGHWLWVNGKYIGHAGGGCHDSGTAKRTWDITDYVHIGKNEIWIWCSEHIGDEQCKFKLIIDGKEYTDWSYIPPSSPHCPSGYTKVHEGFVVTQVVCDYIGENCNDYRCTIYRAKNCRSYGYWEVVCVKT